MNRISGLGLVVAGLFLAFVTGCHGAPVGSNAIPNAAGGMVPAASNSRKVTAIRVRNANVFRSHRWLVATQLKVKRLGPAKAVRSHTSLRAA